MRARVKEALMWHYGIDIDSQCVCATSCEKRHDADQSIHELLQTMQQQICTIWRKKFQKQERIIQEYEATSNLHTLPTSQKSPSSAKDTRKRIKLSGVPYGDRDKKASRRAHSWIHG